LPIFIAGFAIYTYAHKEKDEHHDDDGNNNNNNNNNNMVTRVLFLFPVIEGKLYFPRVVKYPVIAFDLLINSKLSLLARNFSY
jgi:hypothetical protein